MNAEFFEGVALLSRSSTNFTISLTGLPAIGLTLKAWCRKRTQKRSKASSLSRRALISGHGCTGF